MDDIAPTPTETIVPGEARSPADLARVLPPLETEIRATYDGHYKSEHSDASSAAKEWARRKRENQEATGIPDELPVDPIAYIDGRPADATVSADEAAKDLNTYRQQKAAALLAEMTGEAQPGDQQQQPPAEQQQVPADPANVLEQLMSQLPAETRQSLEAQTNAYREQIAADQQRFAEEWNAAQLARNNYILGLHALAANARGHNLQEFADIRTHADLQRVAQQDPARFQRFQQMNQELGQLQTELARVTHEQQGAQQQQFQQQYANWSQQQDQLAEQLIPETRSGDTEALRGTAVREQGCFNRGRFL
jgi:hypothetical protein